MRRMKQFMALGLVVALGMGSVMAVSADSDTEKTSDATITMTADDDTDEPTGPIDPWKPDPNEILEPDPDDGDDDDEEEVTGNKARLRIEYVSNFKFPDTEINTVDQTVYAAVKNMNILDEDGNVTGSKKLPNYAQVGDWRGTGGAGWTLKARISNFEYKDGSDTYVLNGAQVTLKNINTSNAAVQGYVTGFEADSDITLNGSDKDIMVGTGTESQGSNMAYFGAEDSTQEEAGESVELFIPADDGTTLAQTYKAKLTWTLEDTPTP